MNSKTSKVLAVFLTLCLLLSLAAPAFAAGNQITIGTKEELLTFAQNCTLDSWSQGKTVVLTGDIDLTGTDFTPIPTFGGHFDGQGHAITGITLDGSGSNRGLFRYLQKSAVVEDLKVEISITPTDFQDSLGGLVGNNRGLIRNCTVTGNEATVDGSGLYAFDGSHDDNVMKRIGEATFKNCIIKGNYVVSGDVINAQDISINYTDEATAEKRRGVNKEEFPPDGMITEESDPDEYPFWTHELWTARYDGRFTSSGGNTIGKVFRNENIRLAATDKVEAVEPPYSDGSSGCSAASFPLLLLAFGGAAIFFKKR